MDAQRFDALTKALAARLASRRSVVALVAGVVAGGFAAATRPRAAPPATPAASRCPDCGACQSCRIEDESGAVTCGAPCADPCLASVLCEAARGDAAYRLLADALAADGFAPADEPEAVAVEASGALVLARLAAEYADGRDPARTATLVFLQQPGEPSRAHAVVRQGQTPTHALVVDEGGSVQLIEADASLVAAGNAPADGAAVQSSTGCTLCGACDFVCNEGVEYAICAVIGAERCKGVLACILAIEAACALLALAGCEPFCDVLGCAVCDPHCETRTTDCGGCVDRCRQNHPDQRCVDGRCRCVEDDPRVGDTCGPVDDPICCEPLRCEVCDIQSRQCRSRCRSTEVCCDATCRTDVVACGNACCPFLEGLICCDNGCVNWQIDRMNCGECGVRCGEDEICDAGTCRRCDERRCEAYDDGRCVVECAGDEVCDPERGCIPREDDPIDFSVCETWLSNADLLALVTGATDVTSLTSFEAENERGNLAYLCLWDVVSNPQEAEPWFDWLVQVQAALTLRVDEPADRWADGLDAFEAGLGCTPAELPDDRTPVCLKEDPSAVDLTVRLDDDRYLWLFLTSSTTAGAPDYPQLREATERLAAFLVAHLAPVEP